MTENRTAPTGAVLPPMPIPHAEPSHQRFDLRPICCNHADTEADNELPR